MLLYENAVHLLEDGDAGFAIHVANCQESFEFLAREGYVDFYEYEPDEIHFITAGGYHCCDRDGRYKRGFRDSDHSRLLIGSTKYKIIELEDFVAACNGGGETFNNEITLENILEERGEAFVSL